MDVEKIDEIWVSATEGAELTGYHRDYVQKLARDNWSKPENQREIPVRRLTSGYIIWLPALVKYIDKPRRGPQPKRKLK